MSRIQELKRILSLAMQDSRWQDALSVLEKLLKQEENQPAYHNQIGDVLLKMGKQADAIESFLQGVESYRELGMYPNGAALCKKILRLEPGQRNATWLLGELKTKQGFLCDGAERMLEALHYLAEDPSITQDILVKHLQIAEELQSGNKDILEFVATTYAQIGDSKLARDVTLRVADIEERQGNGEKADVLRQLAKSFVLEDMQEAMDEEPAAVGEEALAAPEQETPGEIPGAAQSAVADATPESSDDGESAELETSLPAKVGEAAEDLPANGESTPAEVEVAPSASPVAAESPVLESAPSSSPEESAASPVESAAGEAESASAERASDDTVEPDQPTRALDAEQDMDSASPAIEISEDETTKHGSPGVVNDRKLNEENLLRTLDGTDLEGGSDVELFTTQVGRSGRPLLEISIEKTSEESNSSSKSEDELFDLELRKLGMVDTDVEVLSAEPVEPDVDDEEPLEIIATSMDSKPLEQPDDEKLMITLQEAMSGSGEDDLELTVHGLEIQSAGEALLGQAEDGPGSAPVDESAPGGEAPAAQSESPAAGVAGEAVGDKPDEDDSGSLSSLNRFMKTADPKPRTVGLTTTIGEALQTDDVDQVLQKFREQMAEQMEDMSCEEHYQLGVSYMEMDLFEEALQEFGFTMDHPTLSMKSREWMARCYLKQDRPQEIIQLLADYLSRESYPRKSFVELYYLIGQAFQALGSNDLAVDSFTKVYTLNTEFRDVKARLELLTSRA